MSPNKQPPPGVETTPGGPVVPLSEAAARLNRDPRTLIRAITSGELRGGAMPRPERLRWYVYADELPGAAPQATPPPPPGELDDLRAQVVALQETNRLLIAAQHELLEADAAASERLRSAARLYLDALGQFMTPGHVGELAREL
jgi:hypothetical protein